MRVSVISAAAMCLAAVPVFAQDVPKDVHGPWTLTPTMVMCTDLPAIAKPTGVYVIKDAHSTDNRVISYPGGEVLIAHSEGDGLEIGQRYVASRLIPNPTQPPRTTQIYSDVRVTGVIHIIAINQWHALAKVELACDSVEAGDLLNPYTPTIIPGSAAEKLDPDFSDRALVIFGADNRVLVGDGDIVSINRGSAQGVVPGARYAIYRDKHFNGLALIYLGDAVVMTVEEQTSKVAIVKAVDGILSGDTAVPRRLQPQ